MSSIFATHITATTTDDIGACIADQLDPQTWIEQRAPAKPAYVFCIDTADPSNLIVKTTDGAAYRVSIVRI